MPVRQARALDRSSGSGSPTVISQMSNVTSGATPSLHCEIVAIAPLRIRRRPDGRGGLVGEHEREDGAERQARESAECR